MYISIIIPVFNVETYLDNAFQSIFNQTIGFENLEIIFIDDCSTDNSGLIIDQFSQKYDNVISIHLNGNSGAAGKPRNVGIRYATTDYLMFLDPDDIYRDNACEILYNKITKENVDFVSGAYVIKRNNKIVFPEGYIRNTFIDITENKNKQNEEVKKIINNPNFELKISSYHEKKSILGNFAFWTKIYKKKFIKENNIYFPEGIISQDSVFLLNCLFSANGLIFINDIIVEYNIQRNYGKSITHEKSKKRLKEMLDSFYLLYEISEKNNATDLFVKYLLINKLIYFLESQLFLSRFSNIIKKEIIEYSKPLFIKCIKYKEIIPKYADLFDLIVNNTELAMEDISNIIKQKRKNNKISIIIHFLTGSDKNMQEMLVNILNQQYEDIEIICICNYESHILQNFIDKLNPKKNNIFLFENKTDESWIYKGLKHSSGNYIHFLNKNFDQNDEFYKNILYEDEFDLILFNLDNSSDKYIKNILSIIDETYITFDTEEFLDSQMDINSQVYRTTFIEEYFRDIFKGKLFSESIFTLNYYLKADKIIFR